MSNLQPAIDHVVINVRSALDAALLQYRRLGFQLTERGHHTLGSSNHLAIFGTDYLELLGFEPGRDVQRAGVWEHSPGLSGLVFKPPATDGFAAELEARGVPTDGEREFSRPVDLPGGPQDARFRVVNIPGAVADGRVFFCRHFTPELVWRPEWQMHPNAVSGIATFVVASADPQRTGAVFAKLFGAEALSPVPGGLRLATAGGSEVLFLTPDAVQLHYGIAPPPAAHGAERMVGLTLRTRSLADAGNALAAGGVAAQAGRDGLIVVPPDQACGLILAFQA